MQEQNKYSERGRGGMGYLALQYRRFMTYIDAKYVKAGLENGLNRIGLMEFLLIFEGIQN